MTRAGREPAEDLKRRLAAACQEVGLKVASANMYLIQDGTCRAVFVGASPANWRHGTRMLSIMATIPVTGQWPDFVDIRCSATEDETPRMGCPWMRGRDHVPLSALVDELCATLDEREQVIAAQKLGLPGPYRFEGSVWQRVDPLDSLDLF